MPVKMSTNKDILMTAKEAREAQLKYDRVLVDIRTMP
jgi:hypothetical protein